MSSANSPGCSRRPCDVVSTGGTTVGSFGRNNPSPEFSEGTMLECRSPSAQCTATPSRDGVSDDGVFGSKSGPSPVTFSVPPFSDIYPKSPVSAGSGSGVSHADDSL